MDQTAGFAAGSWIVRQIPSTHYLIPMTRRSIRLFLINHPELFEGPKISLNAEFSDALQNPQISCIPVTLKASWQS